MNTRRQKRRVRIQQAVRFYLQVVRNEEWTSINDIVKHLELNTRGASSYNQVTPTALGQMLRSCDGIDKEVYFFDAHRKTTYYRWFRDEEE